MRAVILDIETAAQPWLELSPAVRRRLVAGARDPRDYRSRRDRLSLSPFTARLIAVALLEEDASSGRVWFDPTGASEHPDAREGHVTFEPADEPAMLASLWKALEDVSRVVTFNGRAFDGPFLAIRSAVHGLVPSRALAGRGAGRSLEGGFEHLDLIEVLSFQGLLPRPSLELACEAFGIASPKSEGLRGEDVGTAFLEGRISEIARYARRDVEATAALWRRISPTLAPQPVPSRPGPGGGAGRSGQAG